jgi:hypothetical protein
MVRISRSLVTLLAPSTVQSELVVRLAETELRSTEERYRTVEGSSTEITVEGLPKDVTGEVRVTVAVPGDAVLLASADPGEEICTIDVATSRSCDTPADLEAGTYDLDLAYSGDTNYGGSRAAPAGTGVVQHLASTGGPALGLLLLAVLLLAGGATSLLAARRLRRR